MTAANLPNDAVLVRTEAPAADARLYLKMRVTQRDSRLRLFRPEDAAVAAALGVEAEQPETREPEAAFGDLIIVSEDGAEGEARMPVAYLRVRRARFIALGSDGKRIACVDA